MTLPTTPPDGERAETPTRTDGRLARLHLGTGLLRLARVELEELAGEGRLDVDGVLDLAEARWRTGDLRGAAEAAGAWLEAGAATGEAKTHGRAVALAHALVADALTVRGRDAEAGTHVAATLAALAPGPPGGKGPPAPARSVSNALDALFAGIAPRADAWPALDPGHRRAASADRVSAGGTDQVHASYGGSATPDPMTAADERLGAGDDAAAAVLLILALRATPIRAQEILQRADAALAARSGAGLLLARGEALRVLGHHEAAGIAYAVADAHARGVAPAVSPAPGPEPTDLPVDDDTGSDAAAAPDPEWSPE